jgi:hypothetical protein
LELPEIPAPLDNGLGFGEHADEPERIYPVEWQLGERRIHTGG